MNTQTQSQERAYIALLGLAEHFRTNRNIRKSIQCLEAVFCMIAKIVQSNQFFFSISSAVRLFTIIKES